MIIQTDSTIALEVTMFSKFGVFAVVALLALVGQSEAQDGCVAQPVSNLIITSDQFLSWVVSADEPCEITEFLVHAWDAFGPDEYSFSVTKHYINMSFLTPCQEYVFVVQPISHHTLGRTQILFSQLPLASDADLSIGYFNATTNLMTDETYLFWGWDDDRYANCSLQYRVTVEEEGQPIVEDIYTRNTTLDLHFLSPCSTYQFGVRAINIGRPTIEGPLKLAFFHIPGHVQGPPHLTRVDQGSRHLNLTFTFESKVRNPCPIDMLYVDGGDSFQKVIELEDEAFRRPAVNVSISALQPERMYLFRTYVSNEAGWSKANVASVQTLEEN